MLLVYILLFFCYNPPKIISILKEVVLFSSLITSIIGLKSLRKDEKILSIKYVSNNH